MFISLYVFSWLIVLAGVWFIKLNAQPYILQIAPFVIVFVIMSFLTGYGHKWLLIVLCVISIIGLSLASLQINGVLSIGHSGVMEIPNNK